MVIDGKYRVLLSVIALIMATVPGCSRPQGERLVPVRGQITLDGKPLERGSVSLRPEPANTWHQPTGTIDKPGEFVVYTNGKLGAPPGSYRVVVFASESPISADGKAHPGLPKSIVPLKYNRIEESPLRLVVDEKTFSYELKLQSDEQ